MFWAIFPTLFLSTNYTGEQNKKKWNGAWDILTDSSCLGSPNTQMNTRLAQSGQIFPQIRFFRPFFRYMAIFCEFFFDLFVAFMEVKTTVLISRFQCKNRFEKRSNQARDIFKNVLRLGEPNQTVGWKQFVTD